MRLKTVLLPEPLGPISPTMVPALTSNEQSRTADKPPNRLVSPCTESTGSSDLLDVDAGKKPSVSFERSALLPGIRRSRLVLATLGIASRFRVHDDLLAVLNLDD